METNKPLVFKKAYIGVVLSCNSVSEEKRRFPQENHDLGKEGLLKNQPPNFCFEPPSSKLT